MAELVSIKRNVDVSPGQAAPAVFHCSQGDVGSKIILGLLNNGTAYAIPSGVTVTIEGSESNGSIFTPISATASGSDITFYLTGEMTAVAGPAICQAVLKSGSNILGTANFTLEVESSPMGADAPPVFTDAGWTWMLNKLNTEFVPALGNETIIDAIDGKADQSDLTALSNTVAGHTGSITVLNNTVNTLNGGVTENRQNIATKLDKNQGTTNAGKYLKVGADGNVENADLDVTTDKTLSIADKAADAKAVGDELDDLKADLDVLIPGIYNKKQIDTYETANSYRLNESDGLCSYNTNYVLKKYQVSAGETLGIVSDDRFQFQTASRVPSTAPSFRVGETYGKGEYIVTAPEDATFLIVSTPATNSVVAVHLLTTKIDYIEKEINDINTDIGYISKETEQNLIDESNLLNVSGARYENGWYSFVANNAYLLWGREDTKPSFPHRTIKDNTQYTLSFDGKYDGSAATGFTIGFKYTDETAQILVTGDGTERHYVLTSQAQKTIAKIFFGWNTNVLSYVKNMMLTEGISDPDVFIPYNLRTAVDEEARERIEIVYNDTQNKLTSLDSQKVDYDLINYKHGLNLYNSYNVIHNKYINPSNGEIADTQYYDFAYSPTYIAVSDGEMLTASDRMFIAFYNSRREVLSALQMPESKQVTVPTGAVYARFSCSASDHSTVKVVKGSVIPDTVETYSFTMAGLKTDEDSKIIVDANGNGDYTSFTEAVYDNVDNGKSIIVKAGTYDVKAEYIALFGQSVVDSLADSTSGINNFQYGIRIHDRKVTFESGAHLVCDWTGKTINATHRFCALRVEPNAEMIGLDLDCTNTFYCIHDDYGTADNSPFTVTYKNCRVIGHNLYNANCIGGGAHKYSRHILENCYFKNNVDSSDIVLSADVRYHNTNTADAEPELYVSNCYFSNNLNVTYYGTQTTKMRAYVNNCYAPKGINKRAESSSMSTDNIELYTWNNQTN